VDPRKLLALVAAALFALLPAAPLGASGGGGSEPLVIGHRGASGYRPEHTIGAYTLAIRQCADYIEPDVVATSDGVLVARHENEISTTTDVAAHPEFAARRTTKVIDGIPFTGWFTEDFTLAELRTLRAKERIPGVRPQNTAFDGLEPIPTLEEVVELAQRRRTCDGRPVGVYPETKHPTYFRSIGLPLEERVVDVLHRHGFLDADDPAIIQSFEVGNLRHLAGLTEVRLAQLINCTGAPYDVASAGHPYTYADLVTPAGLEFIAGYADVVGVCKDVLIRVGADGRLGPPTPVTADAHAQGLDVHAWTFRRENLFLPPSLRSGPDLTAPGDMVTEVRTFLAAGVDGVFTDNPDLAVAATSK
jgi:glycerophosphoryl diester phosphodiesterase